MKGMVNEARIVSWVMENRTVQPLLDRNVDPSWFFNDQPGSDHRGAIKCILDHHAKYGLVPTVVTLRSQVGASYQLGSVKESIEYLLDQQANACRWQEMKRMLPDVEDHLDARETEDAVDRIEKVLAKIRAYSPDPSPVVDSMADERADTRWDDYEKREAGGGIIGMTTGFPTIDGTTMGLQPGHLITVLAQPKVGKTTVCLAMADHIYVNHKSPILFVSFEMGVREIENRQDSLMAGLNYKRLQQGGLTLPERQAYADHIDEIHDSYTWPFHIMDASAGSTVGAMRGQVERYRPEVLFLDGIYMMVDEATGESNTATALTNITRSLKRLAVQAQIPIVINTQALGWKSKGNRITMDSAGYSSSFAQDSDVVLGLERITPAKGEDESAYLYQRTLRVLASRNSGLAQVEIIFDYDKGDIGEAR